MINVAPTGMVAMRSEHPTVPERPDQIAGDVAGCHEAGASSVHLHARDTDGQPTYRSERYAQVIHAVRAIAPDLIICVSRTFEPNAILAGVPARQIRLRGPRA